MNTSSIPTAKHPAQSITFSPDQPWLAPLAGYTDLSFRLLCREQGAAVACTEMVSAKGLIYGLRSRKAASGTEALLATIPQDSPLVVQLFGTEIPFLEQALDELRQRGFTWFDLNMGCSVPKVNKTGAGSAMLKDIPSALAVAKAMIAKTAPGTMGFKIRLGWSAPESVYIDLAKALEQLGAGWITLHPRFAKQGFSGVADWTALAALVRAVTIPVIASGDLLTAADAVRCIQETDVASVMFARGAITNPSIFYQYQALLATDKLTAASFTTDALTANKLLTLILRHAELAKQWTTGKPDTRGISPSLRVMRTTTPRYVRHLPGIKELRYHLSTVANWNEFDTVLRNFFYEYPNKESL